VKLSGAGLKRGDKISFAGVKYLSQMAKNILTQDATFSVVAVNGNDVTITPKPVALSDDKLTPEERAYANVNISLADGMAVNVLNIKTTQANVFWADDSIRLVSQPIPVNHDLFSGMKTQSFSIPNVGLNGVVAYQGDIGTLSGKCRIALWYSACAVRPEAIGVGLAGQK
ncbi:P22 phage major capsid protein family protein, partial [Xenorhabdus bovienii]